VVAASTGAKTFTLTYSGDSNYAFVSGSNTASASVTNGTVNLSKTMPAAGTVSKGETFTVEVLVTAAQSTPLKPTGTALVTVGSASCTATILSSTGEGSCSMVAAAGGTAAVSVVYSGDPNFDSKTITDSYTITATPTVVSIATVSPGTPTVGSSLTATVTLTSAVGLPPGTVDVTENGVAACSVASSAMVANSGSCSWTATAAGSRTLLATFVPSNSADFAPDTDSRLITVNGLYSATTIGTLSPLAPTAGAAFSVPVTVTSSYATAAGGTVTLSDGTGGTQGSCGSWSPATAAVSHTITCNFTAATTGGKTLKATFNGNTALNSSFAQTPVTIAKGTTTVTIGTLAGPNSGSPSTLVLNRPVTVPVTVSGGTGNVVVSYSAGGSCIATLASGSGSCAIQSGTSGGVLTATYGGDSNFSGSSTTFSPVTLVKTPTDTTIDRLDPVATTGVAKGKSYLVWVRVAAQSGFGTPSISGGTMTVTATWSGGSASCVPAISSNTGACGLTAPSTATTLSITAVYGGNASFAGSSTAAGTSYPVY